MPLAHTNKRFIKDFLLPFPVADPEYIFYYVNLFDEVYHSKEKYDMYLTLFNKLGGDENFFLYSKEIQEAALNKIKNSPAYDSFIHDTCDLFSGYKWLATNVPKGQVYKGINDGKKFLSIDLVKANYQALKYYTRNILDLPANEDDLILGTNSFDEFIRKFTEEEYFMKAKKFRQVIFGNMNPKRQQTIQKYIINEILAYLFTNNLIPKENLKDYTSDEIVFEITNIDIQDILDDLKWLQSEMKIDLHLDIYTLKWLKKKGDNENSKEGFFVREFDDGRIDFKGIENSLMPQVYKHYKGMFDLREEDLLFYASNGMLARYVKPIEW